MPDIADLNVDLQKVASMYFIDPEECDKSGLSRDDPNSFKRTSKSREGRAHQVYNKRTYARLVSGCLVLNDSFDKVLMVSSSKHRNRWIFPKGGIEYDEKDDFRETARRETWEEAGVTGTIVKKLPTVEDHRFLKRKKVDKKFQGVDLTIDGDRIPRSEFHFFEMKIIQLWPDWPEKGKRSRKWCTYDEAKHELISAERPELLDALNHSRIKKNCSETKLDEHSYHIFDAKPNEDGY